MGGKAADPDGELVDAPGSSQWRYNVDSLASGGLGLVSLHRSGTPTQNQQHTLYSFGTLSTVPAPPRGWTKATGYRLVLMGASGVPLDAVSNASVHLEVRSVMSPGSPLIDLTLSGYSQTLGFNGNIGDMRAYTYPIKFNLMVTGDVPQGLSWCQLVLQYGATTL